MKKILLAMLLLLCAFSFCNCGGEEPSEEPRTCTVTYIWQSPAAEEEKTYSAKVLYGRYADSIYVGQDVQYAVEGWYRDGVKWNFSDPVVEDMTLTAQWVRRTYTVSFIIEDEVRAESDRYYGEKAVDPYVDNRDFMTSLPEWKKKIENGYRFAGWMLDDTLWDFENDTVTGDIVLVAYFLPVEEQ